MKIWVDDLRPAPDSSWLPVQRSEDAIELLHSAMVLSRAGGTPDHIEVMSLDHDLGGDDTTRPIVLWMCENEFWPAKVVVHSANPVGIDWLEGMIERYQP